jgi:hypothetical protein
VGAGAARPGTLLALGDSITNASRSWAWHLAQALALRCVTLARDGLTAPALRDELLGRVEDGHAVGALHIGVNDVRHPGWDPERFEAAFASVVARVVAAAERVVVCTVPLDLGRPRAGGKVADCNAIIRGHAARVGAAVASLEDLAGEPWLQADAVHLTDAGQREVGARAARVLAAAHGPT